MKILHTIKKGKIMNTLENFHIYQQTKQDNQINDKKYCYEEHPFR